MSRGPTLTEYRKMLLPCPCCKGHAIISYTKIQCERCKLVLNSRSGGFRQISVKQMVNMWNRRSDSGDIIKEKIKSEHRELEKELKKEMEIKLEEEKNKLQDIIEKKMAASKYNPPRCIDDCEFRKGRYCELKAHSCSRGSQDYYRPKGVLMNNPKESESEKCASCSTPLGIPGGMGETGLCGPCCTGEAETISERGETW